MPIPKKKKPEYFMEIDPNTCEIGKVFLPKKRDCLVCNNKYTEEHDVWSVICPDCKKNTVLCDHCGTTVASKKEITKIDGKSLCSICCDLLYDKCKHCHTITKKSTMKVTGDGKKVCNTCHTALYGKCNQCGQITLNAELKPYRDPWVFYKDTCKACKTKLARFIGQNPEVDTSTSKTILKLKRKKK